MSSGSDWQTRCQQPESSYGANTATYASEPTLPSLRLAEISHPLTFRGNMPPARLPSGARSQEDAGPGYFLQAKLLDALEQRAARRLGAVRCHFEWGELGRRITDASADRHLAEAGRLFADLGMSSTILISEGET
jgi:hypothetical protein